MNEHVIFTSRLLVSDPFAGEITEKGAILIDTKEDKTVIKEVDLFPALSKKYPDAKVVDFGDDIIMPGFVLAHHHLYSTFARGFSTGKSPKNFVEVLETLWWKLDKLLTEEDIYYSCFPPLIDCIKNGVTSVIDHHESQGVQLGSMEKLMDAVKETGVRANLCYGVSDRYGKGAEGIKENRKFLKKASKAGSLISGMAGLHAPMTVNDDTLKGIAELAKEFNTGVHIHTAEDLSDEEDSIKKYGMRVMNRLEKLGVLSEKSICVHCIHINEEEMDILKNNNAMVVHNPESNMNNAVGAMDLLKIFGKGILLGLGSDGMSSDIRKEARAGFLLAHHAQKNSNIAFVEILKMLLVNNPEIFGRVSGSKVGKIKPGYKADFVAVDYNPPTPMDSSNFLGHFLFGIYNSVVNSTVVNGKVLMKDRKLKIDEAGIYEKTRELSARFWERFRAEK